MITTIGEYKDLTDNKSYKVALFSHKTESQLYVYSDEYIVSAFKKLPDTSYSVVSNLAKEIWEKLSKGFKYCGTKNCSPTPFELGVASRYMFERSKINYTIEKYRDCISGCEISAENFYLYLRYTDKVIGIPEQIEWVKLSEPKAKKASKSLDAEFMVDTQPSEDVVIRTLGEIGLEKDLTWLEEKKYYIVNDESTAEQIISLMEQLVSTRNVPVAYDVETSGLLINMFGKIGSEKKDELERINEDLILKGKTPFRVDTLTGLILTVEPNVSYYFPVRHRKYRNLYEGDEDGSLNDLTINTINRIRAAYTVGDYRDRDDDMARFIRNHKDNELGCDVILMERIRWLLTHANLVAHGGIFEWKTSWLYNIDLNLRDDTMVLHKLLYKFSDMSRGNLGERSDLKYLTKKHFGADQLELSDFFVGYSEDDTGIVSGSSKRKKKKTSKIDFSYMDYEGSRAYAPADGDFTLQLYYKFKKDLIENHANMDYLYQFEIIVSCAIAYMEFYGHRIDEEKIEKTKVEQVTQKLLLEEEFRKIVGYSNDREQQLYDEIKYIIKSIDVVDKELAKKDLEEGRREELKEQKAALIDERIDNARLLREEIDKSEKVINLASPAQMAQLFFADRKIPVKPDEEGKFSVSKKVLKQFDNLKNEDGTLKYPEIAVYKKWKSLDTLLTKFFDSLPDFMYPGGYIFSRYGQINTATGRMSCIREGTLVNTTKGMKAIEKIRVGDRVYCLSDNGNLEKRVVKSVPYRGRKLCYRFIGKYEDGCKAVLECTPDHKIKTEGGWKEAKDIKITDTVFTWSGEKINLERDLDYGAQKYPVYDLEIDEIHNFFAGGICVHNCSKPNAQQYTSTVTKIVCPRPGYVMMDADFSQIEYRTLVALAQEKHLIEKFYDTDMDYHTMMASLMYGVDYALVTPKMRSDAKSFNFGIPYGMGFGSLAILLTGNKSQRSIEEAKEKYELYFKDQPKVRQYFIDIKEKAKFNQLTETLWHRVRKYDFTEDGKYSKKREGQALRQAGNAVIQGCLHGDTKINTLEYGLVRIKDVEGKRLHVWDGKKWSRGDVLYSGKKKKCKVVFSNGQSIVCSPIHKFLVGKHFIECKDLKSREFSTTPHKVKMNIEYGKSNYTIAKPGVDRFSAGDYLSTWSIDRLPAGLFTDTEMTRGYLKGLFTRKGLISKENISLECGLKRYDYEQFFNSLREVLMFFGVASRITKYDSNRRIVLRIQKSSIQRFLKVIGLDDVKKQEKAERINSKYHRDTLTVEKVILTDEEIDMYDVCNTDGGYYVANGLITHNTAADIFKIAVARTFLFIRNNNLYGDFLITNMIHDEQLTEVNVQKLNAQVILKNLIECMELKLENFPPLYVGAGVGMSWSSAKGKMAEIHPNLAHQFIEEAKNMPLRTDTPMEPREVIEYFDHRVKQFRIDKIRAYIEDKNNWGKAIHPVIGSLLSLQFDFGVTEEFKQKYTEANGYTKEEIDEGLKGISVEQIARFIAEYNIDVDSRNFVATTHENTEEPEDAGYDDSEEFDEDGNPIETTEEYEFSLVDDSNEIFGIDVRDVIKTFGVVVSKKRRICGLDTSIMTFRAKDSLADYLVSHLCEEDEEGAVQIVYLKDNNTLLNTGQYVSDVNTRQLEKILLER